MKLEGLYRHLLLKSKRFSNNTNKIDENGQKEVTKIKIQKKAKEDEEEQGDYNRF